MPNKIEPDSISAVMITMDRGYGNNFLYRTLANLRYSGFFDDPRICQTVLFDSGGGRLSWLMDRLIDPKVITVKRASHVPANRNVGEAINFASGCGEWVLFLEDDLDFCIDWIASLASWMEKNNDDKCLIYSLASPYPETQKVYDRGGESWVYPAGSFYGTQCVLMRKYPAQAFALYCLNHIFDKNKEGTSWDLLMSDWVATIKGANITALCPSLVEHIGATSIVNPRTNIHKSPSWQGNHWLYK